MLGCSYMANRQAVLEAKRADAMAGSMEQHGYCSCKGRPYRPLLVTAVVHKVHVSPSCNAAILGPDSVIL